MTEGGSCTDDDVDLDELASLTTKELSNYWSRSETHDKRTEICMIYKVPKHIHDDDRTAYDPFILSIGPYHHGGPGLLAMEKEKWNCLDYILKLNREKSLQDYLNVIWGLEEEARRCYSEEVEMESKKFLQMLLLDGCFLLVSLYGTEGIKLCMPEEYDESTVCQEIIEENGSGENELGVEHIKNKAGSTKMTTPRGRHSIKGYLEPEVELSEAYPGEPFTRNDNIDFAERGQCRDTSDQLGEWFFGFVAHDLLLLENQIPFFIVERIYELVARNNAATSFTDEIAKFIEDILHDYPTAIQESKRPNNFHHLLHLSHMYFRPSRKLDQDNQYQPRYRSFHYFLHLGCKYFKIGHQSEKSEQNLSDNQLNCFQDGLHLRRWRRAVHYHEAGVKFKRKEFDKHNPHSLLDIRFGNGVVEIPCLHVDENTLISTPADVTLLVQVGIIVHQLRRDAEISALFTKLNKDVVFDFNGKYYLKSLSWALEAHYQSRLNRWVAWLRNNHFSNPWLALGVLAATVVLFCTLVQTLIAVLSYIKPP
uniref:Uncharacterized protein n=1 Tax=Ananas comosus var. bracteatus TaxID=296719 RepID=A0A6V7PVQ3_ANACO|nr:unnamed protein product [Ananas comosus var. bracteatus]